MPSSRVDTRNPKFRGLKESILIKQRDNNKIRGWEIGVVVGFGGPNPKYLYCCYNHNDNNKIKIKRKHIIQYRILFNDLQHCSKQRKPLGH